MKTPEEGFDPTTEMKEWGQQTLAHLLQFLAWRRGENRADDPEEFLSEVEGLAGHLWEGASDENRGASANAVAAAFIRKVLDEVARRWTPGGDLGSPT